jgi:hypothetical protein
MTYFQEQAETEVTVKPSTAYPLAHVSVMLATKHVDFMDILIGRIVKHCPYIIPRYYDDDPVSDRALFTFLELQANVFMIIRTVHLTRLEN